jgi:hypothetical protein
MPPGPDVGLAKGHHGDGDERAAERDDGREQIERPVDAGGNQVFFEEDLAPSTSGCSRPKGPHAAGSPAVLDAAHQLALQQHGVGDASSITTVTTATLSRLHRKNC